MKLSDQSVVVDAPRELCFEVVAAAGRRLEKHSEKEWVVEFTTFAGDREFRTVELLTLERPSVIHYRWLEGPLSEVRGSSRSTTTGPDLATAERSRSARACSGGRSGVCESSACSTAS